MTATVQIVESNLSAGRDINIQVTLPRPDPMEILQKYVAFEALHDSAKRSDPPGCHAGTRTTVLRWIDEWARNKSDDAKPILWLTGAAGVGKTAIARTMIEKWKKKIFSANFFFWGTGDQRKDKTHLVATLAFQLANKYPEIKGLIERAVVDTGVFQKNIRAQMEDLLVHPVANLPQENLPVILVIDGLDECSTRLASSHDHEQQQKEILEAVGQICHESPGKFKFLIASRPERPICEAYGRGSLPEKIYFQLSLNNAPDTDVDIKRFLKSTFEDIRQCHPGIDPSWPSEDQVSTLLEKSSGQFLYPSMAMKHIRRPRTNPVDNLKAVLELQPGSTNKPFAELDALYTFILSSVTEESRPVATNILRTILGPDNGWVSNIFTNRPADASPLLLKQFLFLDQHAVYLHLSDLHSVLDISQSPDHNNSIRLIHATFAEYLQDPLRSGEFFISDESIFHHWVLSALIQLKKCIEREDPNIHIPILLATVTLWLSECPPARDLMKMLWDMMEDDIGPYPSLHSGSKLLSFEPRGSPDTIITESGTVRLRVLVEEWNKRIKEIKIKMQDLCVIIDYLQKCNVPDIEPSWWRRYVIHRRLEIAFLRLRREESHVGPVSKYDIVLDTTRDFAPELGEYQHAMRHKFWIYLLLHLTSHFRT